MASINDLDETTLWRIFDRLIEYPLYSIGSWKLCIKLISVCKQWRDMLYYYTYGYAFLIYEEDPEYEETIDTNIGLIRSRDMHNFVTSLTIILTIDSDYLQTIISVIERYIFIYDEWPTINELTVSMCPCTDSFDFPTYSNQYSDSIERSRLLGEGFVKRMPKITSLQIRLENMIIPNIFTSVLVNAYGKMLYYLECSSVNIHQSIAYFPSQLTHLSLDFSNVNIAHFPTVLPDSLKLIKLLNLPSNFSLIHFANPNNPNIVSFPSLTHLTLKHKKAIRCEYAIGKYVRKPHHCTIHSPKLTYLCLEHPSPDCDILYSLPEIKMAAFKVKGIVPCVEFLSSQPLSATESINIGVVDSTLKTSQLLCSATNNFFSQHKNGLETHLSFYGVNCNLDLKDIHWEYLMWLRIEPPIGAASLLHLLQSLPNIKQLQALNIISDSRNKQSSGSSRDYDAEQYKKHHEFQYLSIRRKAFYNSASHIEMIDLICSVLLTIPTLGQLGIQEEFEDDIGLFIRLNETMYPHLNSIPISFGNKHE